MSEKTYVRNVVLNKILNETAGIVENEYEGDDSSTVPVVTYDTPAFCIPLTNAVHRNTVEVVPGVMVSQHLIDEAVRLTSFPSASTDQEVEAIERRAAVKAKDHDELRQDISTSRQIVQSMIDRVRNPAKFDEKYVSYDSMPKPIQRIVKAYMDVDAANKELEEAIKGVAQLASNATPVTAKD